VTDFLDAGELPRRRGGHRRRRRGRTRWVAVLFVLLLVSGLALGGVWAGQKVLSRFEDAPDYAGPGSGEAVVQVEPGDTAEQVAEAQRQMVRIGIDRPAGAADGGIDTWSIGSEVRSYRTATFADLVEARDDDLVVLDVRRDDEWAEGRIDGAVHIPLHDLEGRLDDVPDGEVWVHCASGYRASIAASLLDRAGRRVVAIDDEWAAAAKHEALGVSAT